MTVTEKILPGRSEATERGADGERRTPVAICGGGISGLALAAFLTRAGVDVRVFERESATGGVMGSARRDGFLFERGPNTVLDKFESFGELLDWAGVADEARRTSMRNQERYIWRAGRLHSVPAGAGKLARSGLFSARAKMRLMREPFVKPVQSDEPLRTFVERRFGSEVYARAFEPMVSGIWAGDPKLMSTAATFPMLKDSERESGSVIKGFIAKAKASKGARRAREAEGKSDKPARPSMPEMVTLEQGLGRLTQALQTKLGDRVITGAQVRSITPADRSGGGTQASGFTIEIERETGIEQWSADEVVLCGEAWNTAEWIEAFAPEAAARLAGIHYCPLAVIGLGVETSTLTIPEGFGFLAARGEGLRVLGAIFNSNFQSGRAPEGCATLTVMLGGDLDPEAARLGDDELLKIVQHDLRLALGWDGRSRVFAIRRWERAIPRYGMDYFEIQRTLDEVEKRHEGIRFFGNWRAGVSVAERIELAMTAAGEIARNRAEANVTGGQAN